MQTIDLGNIISREFLPMWRTNCPTRYRVIYGARATGKSYSFVGLEPLDKILRDPNRNIVFFRKVFTDIKDSCFAEIQNALYRTGLIVYFQVKTHDLEIVYKRTGQKILFVGCDRGTAINGIQVPKGEVTDFYFEEAFEIDDYDTFRKIDGSIRGQYTTHIKKNNVYVPKQVTFLMNPWSAEGCWIYDKFVKKYQPDTKQTQDFLEKIGFRMYKNLTLPIEKGIGLALHQSTYKCNHHRDPNTDLLAQVNKKNAPLLYITDYLGMWGVTGEVVYPEFSDRLIIPSDIAKELNYSCYYIGIDTAFSNGEGQMLQGQALERARIHHAYAIVLCGLTRNDYKGIEKGTLVAIDEFYHTQEISNQKLSQPELMSLTLETIQKWFSKYQNTPTLFRGMTYCFVDSGDAGSLQALEYERKERHLGQICFKPSTKKKINTRIRFERQLMANQKIRVSTECPHLIREIRNCREGKGKPREDINDHSINAFEYGTAPMYQLVQEWKNFKEY